ncbi:Arabinogalactan endo-1,4-beta-galactosidase [Reticulomyxa filosa]|uniref:arabinogalactan endo-beta-1,4-galactanase n=1 Tax=Reticulomyxa filosa TaxID=46433 RepID=X6NGH8_RETFI|nr:Arabinogalactan endo-1,4-beta-galactosidase [Reticulomyxa filosa]|eukprot:ETO25101.1 Arabinogalactan endo-1,4-beta-galactosidase [Reticulomyxa filosa]
MNNFLYGADFTVLETLDKDGEENVFYLSSDHSAANDGLTILKTKGGWEEKGREEERGKKVQLKKKKNDDFTSNTTQSKPQAWKTFTGVIYINLYTYMHIFIKFKKKKKKRRKLAAAVHDWAKSVMKTLDDAKALPDIVSIGHEIENGILFTEPKQNCAMVGGYIGSPYCHDKNMAHRPRIMLHTSLANLLFLGRNGADEVIKFYSELNEKQKVAFDIIGLTFYPGFFLKKKKKKNTPP